MNPCRLLCSFVSLLLLAGAGVALAPTGPASGSGRPAPPPLGQAEAVRCARQLELAAKLISQNYFQEVAEEKLLGAAVLALCKAAGTAPPAELAKEPENWFAGRDAVQEITQLRKALGKPPALKNDVAVGLAGMLALLDPYSVLLDPEGLLAETVQMQVETGLSFEERDDPEKPWIVRGVASGSPADEVGLKPGDALLAVDGLEPSSRLNATAFAQRLAFPADGARRLTVRAPEAEPRAVTLKLGKLALAPESFPLFGMRRIDADTWDYWLDPRKKIAYFRFGSLVSGINHVLAAELEQLRREGLSAVILDLRDCPGGVLDGSAALAEVFLEEGKQIATVRYGNPSTPTTVLQQELRRAPLHFRTSRPALVPPEVKVAVLIGPDTRGGGELLAAALQDHRRAAVVGERTLGKGTVQPVMQDYGLPDFRLSTGLIFRPNGKSYHRLPGSRDDEPWGVRPDDGCEVRTPAIVARQIRRWRHDLERRPLESRDVSPLDNPDNDPVLAAALRALQTAKKPAL